MQEARGATTAATVKQHTQIAHHRRDAHSDDLHGRLYQIIAFDIELFQSREVADFLGQKCEGIAFEI